MTRDVRPDEDEDEAPEPSGRVGPTSVGALTGFALTGLVLGWLLRPVGTRIWGVAPTVQWLPVLTLLFVAAIVGAVAWVTYGALHRRNERIEPHRAVNRLVLGKACALVGALVGGGYLGYALSWLGVTAELAEQRMLRSLVGGVAGALVVVTSLLLERACRVRDDEGTSRGRRL